MYQSRDENRNPEMKTEPQGTPQNNPPGQEQSAAAPEFPRGLAMPGKAAITTDVSTQSTAKATPSTSQAPTKLAEAYEKVIVKLFLERENGKERCFYGSEVEALAKEQGMTRKEVVAAALKELIDNGKNLERDDHGRITNAKKIGPHFASLIGFINEKIDLYVISDKQHLNSPDIPLSDTYRTALSPIVDSGEAVILMLTKLPPEEAAKELKQITKEKFHGIWSLWSDERYRSRVTMSPLLEDYLTHGTVKIRTTSKDPGLNKIAAVLNEHLEKDSGFEDDHWIRVVHSIAKNEKKESLKEALKMCVPVIVAVKAAEIFLPAGFMHAIGGAMDDFFAAILPDAKQNEHKDEEGDTPEMKAQNKKQSRALMIAGAATLPFAAYLGYFAGHAYSATASFMQKTVVGSAFALACCAGTLATSVGAYVITRNAIKKLERDPATADLVEEMSPWQKAKLAFKESIMGVPFRIGHTVIGVPLQFGASILGAHIGGFDSTWFIVGVGVAESVLGAVTAFAYPHYANRIHRNHLRNVDIPEELLAPEDK